MNWRWKNVRLGDVAALITKGTTPTTMGFPFVDEGINFVKVESIAEDGTLIQGKFAKVTEECHSAFRRSQIADGDILFSIAGALGRSAIATEKYLPANTNQAVAIIRLKERSITLPEYVLYALKSGAIVQQIERNGAGSAQQNLSLKQLSEFTIPLPAAEEQRRIVAVLDEAFAAIATATANTEKNVANARELFEQAIKTVISGGGSGWEAAPFEDCLDPIKYLAKVQRKAFLAEGAFPIISQEASFINGYWDDAEDLLRVPRPLVVFGDHTQVLKYVDFDFVLGADGVKLLLPKPAISGKFLYYFLRANPMPSAGYARHYRHLKSLTLRYPSLVEQHAITDRLGAVGAATAELEDMNRSKIDMLRELKQSLLQRAFAGELTPRERELVPA